jgi:hypothetical protein
MGLIVPNELALKGLPRTCYELELVVPLPLRGTERLMQIQILYSNHNIMSCVSSNSVLCTFEFRNLTRTYCLV